MKKFIKYLCAFIIMFTFINVKAATLKVSSGSSSAGNLNGTSEVSLSDNDITNYTKVTFDLIISDSDNASITGFEPSAANLSSAGMQFYNDGNNSYRIEALDGKTLSSTTIGSVTYKTTSEMNAAFTITPVNVKFYNAEGTEVSGGVSSGTIRYEAPKSNDANLSSLTVSQGTLSPEFSSDVTEYSVVVMDTISTIRISASTNYSKATKAGTGSQSLNMGENKFEIIVTAEDGSTTKTYTITVNRGAVNEVSADISSLSIKNSDCVMDSSFDPEKTEYNVTVGSEVSSLTLDIETTDKDATIDIVGNENFVVGENKVVITITSSDGEESKDYTLLVTKEEGEVVDAAKPLPDEVKEEKKSNIWIIILIIVLVLLVGLFIFFMSKKKKRKKVKRPLKLRLEDILEDDDEVVEKAPVKPRKTLFDEEKTTSYNKDELLNKVNTSENLEKTKEFNINDFK